MKTKKVIVLANEILKETWRVALADQYEIHQVTNVNTFIDAVSVDMEIVVGLIEYGCIDKRLEAFLSIVQNKYHRHHSNFFILQAHPSASFFAAYPILDYADVPDEVLETIEKYQCNRDQIHRMETQITKNGLDSKTGLLDRSTFIERAKTVLQQDLTKQYVLVVWDIDKFRLYNREFGVAKGDELLKKIGIKCITNMPNAALSARFSADFFVHLVPFEQGHLHGICAQTQRWFSLIEPNFQIIPRYGFYIITDHKEAVEAMCDKATIALRTIKNSFNTLYAYYNTSMDSAILQEYEIVSQMHTALKEDQFLVYFQPQYDGDSGMLCGAEALVRWNHPTRGLIPPQQFIPLFEKNGFIAELDGYVRERCCMYLKKWLQQGLSVVPLSANVSHNEFIQADFFRNAQQLIEKYELDSKWVKLEITETVFADSLHQVIENVALLEKIGISVEIDDFGSGYSSLNILRKLPVSAIKLDMNFLGVDIDNRGGTILSSIVRMAHMLTLNVIAEGVETKAQVDFLNSIGCTHMQGYYFAKPMPVEHFEKLLKTGEIPALSVENLEENKDQALQFLNADTQATLIFNSYVGGAIIAEYDGKTLCALRVNDNMLKIVRASRAEYGTFQADLLATHYPESRQCLVEAIEQAISSGMESQCETKSSAHDGSGIIYTKVRIRVLSRFHRQFILYLAVDDITEQKELSLLKESQSKQMRKQHFMLEMLYNTVPCGIIEFEAQNEGLDGCKILSINKTGLDIYGYESESDYIRANEKTLALHDIYPEDLAFVLKTLQQFKTNDTGKVVLEHRIVRRNSGEILWVRNYMQRVVYHHERIIQSVFMDITAQKTQEQTKFHTVLFDQFEQVCEIDYEQHTLVIRASKYHGKELINRQYELSQAVHMWCDSFITSSYREAIKTFILKQPQTIRTTSGKFQIQNHQNQYHWGQMTIIRIERSVYLLCAEDITAKLFYDVHRQELEFPRLEQRDLVCPQSITSNAFEAYEKQLKEKSKMLMQIFDEVVEVDFEKETLQIISSNYMMKGQCLSECEFYEAIRDFIKNRVDQRYQREATHFFDFESIKRAFIKDERHSMKIKLYLTKERTGWYEFAMFPLDEHRYLLCVKNVTEQHIAEELEAQNAVLQMMNQNNERYRIIIDHTDTAVLEWNHLTGESYRSELFSRYKLSTFDPDQQLKQTLKSDFLLPEDQSILERFLGDIRKGVSPAKMLIRQPMCDGSYRWTETECIQTKDEDGNLVRTISTYKDVHEVIEAQRRLKQMSERLEDVIQHIPVGLIVYEMKGESKQPLFISDKVFLIYGALPNEKHKFKKVTAQRYVEWNLNIQSMYERLLAGETVEFRLQTKKVSGQPIWVRMVCSATKTDDQNPLCYVSLLDVTNTVKKEQEEHRLLERYRLISEMQNVITIDYDVQTDYLQMTLIDENGKPIESDHEHYRRDFMKNNWRVHPKSVQMYTDFLSRVDQTEGVMVIDYLVRFSTQQYRWNRLKTFGISNDKGEIVRVVGRIDDIHETILLREELLAKAQFDAMTGALNKETFVELIEKQFSDKPLHRTDALLVVDIDNFKNINDSYGHQQGDEVIKQIVAAIKDSVYDTDMVGRFGGDEFVVYMPSTGNTAQVSKKAHNIIQKIRSLTLLPTVISCSIGICITHNEPITFHTLFAHADNALYQAKRNGKSQYCVYPGNETK